MGVVGWWVTGQVSTVETEWKAAVTLETIVIMRLHNSTLQPRINSTIKYRP